MRSVCSGHNFREPTTFFLPHNRTRKPSWSTSVLRLLSIITLASIYSCLLSATGLNILVLMLSFSKGSFRASRLSEIADYRVPMTPTRMDESGTRAPPPSPVSTHFSTIMIGFPGQTGNDVDSEERTAGVADGDETADHKVKLTHVLGCSGEDHQAAVVSKMLKDEDDTRTPQSTAGHMSTTMETTGKSENFAVNVKVTQGFGCAKQNHRATEIYKASNEERVAQIYASGPGITRVSTMVDSAGRIEITVDLAAQAADRTTTSTQALDSAADDQAGRISMVRKDRSGTNTLQTLPVVSGNREVEVPGTLQTVGQAHMEHDAGVSNTSRSSEPEVTLKDMVVWFSNNHKAFKLPELREDGNHRGNTPENPVSSRTNSQVLHRSSKLADLRQAKHEECQAVEVITSQSIRRLSPGQLQHLKALAKREFQQLETETEPCSQGNAGLHRGGGNETENVFERALGNMNQTGDMNIEYDPNLVDIQRMFESMSCRLRKTKDDLAGVKHTVSGFIRMRCRCWWCRGVTRLQTGYYGLRDMLPTMRLIGRQLREWKTNCIRTRIRRTYVVYT